MTDEQTSTPPESVPKPAEFKKEPSAKVIISEDELKSLENKVLSKKQETEAELYKKAMAELRAEMDSARLAAEATAHKVAQEKALVDLKAEVEALKNRPVSGTRKGMAVNNTPPEGLVRKTSDGRYGVPSQELADATLRVMFPEHSKKVRVRGF